MEHMVLQVAATAQRAGEAIMQLRKAGFGSWEKEGGSPVTDADMRSDAIIRDGLSRYGWPILSEESTTADRSGAEYVWIVDPLDGTRSFADGGEDFCVMIGLVRDGAPVLAVVYQPPTGKLYTALRGGGAFLGAGTAKKKLSVSTIIDVAKARFISSRNHIAPETDTLARSLGIAHIERVGSVGVKMGLIAEGRFELFFNPTDKMSEWDMCAPHLILEESGGRVTGALGQEFIYNKTAPQNSYGILATNGALHEKVVQAIRIMMGKEYLARPEKAAAGMVLWFTGLSGSGKTTIAGALKKKLEAGRKRVCIIDGDAVRKGHERPLGFSREDIRENNRRIAELARAKSASHDVVLVPVIAPYREDRARNREIIGEKYTEVFVDCPLAVCEARDVKGLYKKARSGEMVNLIGVSKETPYEKPIAPHVVIDTSTMAVGEGVAMILKYINIGITA